MWSNAVARATLVAMHDPSSGHEQQRAALREVDRFAASSLAPAVERHERPMTWSVLEPLLARAETLGLGGCAVEPAAEAERDGARLEPWGDNDGPVLVAGATLRIWCTLSRTSTAVALALHQRALARFVLRAAGASGPVERPCALVAEGRFGLGRLAFARAFGDGALDAQTCAFLEDVYDASKPRVVTIEPETEHFVMARFSPARGLGFAAYARDALVVAPRAHAHGLDELATHRVAAAGAPWWTDALDAPDARKLAASVFAAHQLALVAISLGAVERAHAMARRYAGDRMQGGREIHSHPAVLALLGKTRCAATTAGAQLDSFADRPLDREALFDAISLRATAHPLLADAANAALQVFGGLGYMRDTGVEKAVRDVNHLRAGAGSPPELSLVLGEWGRCHE